MKSTSVFKPLCVLITSLVLIICAPQAFARGGGHGGGGFGGGGFHGGGFGGGGFHGGGWHGGGYGGWRGGGWGGYGWRGYGWGCCGWRGWGPGWGWGFGVGFGWGWGWGSYWGGYPYAYGYPYYPYSYPYYPYYPYRPYDYDGPYAGAPQTPGAYNANPAGNSQQRNSSMPNSDNRPAGLVTSNATTPRSPASNRPLVASDTDTSYRTASFTQELSGLRPQARNVIRALLAMPPQARRRQVESGRYSNFSPEEQELFRNAAQLPPAPERISGD